MTATNDLLVALLLVAIGGGMLYFLARGRFGWKPLLVALVLVICGLMLWYPGRWDPSQRLRLGLDLAGGTTLTYEVRVPEHVPDEGRAIDDLIGVLRDRVDPSGTRNLVWQRIAGNRIQIQMPQATRDTAELRNVFDDAREALAASNITRQQIDTVLRSEPDDRQQRIAQEAGDDAQLRQQLEQLVQAREALVRTSEPYEAAQREIRAAEAALEQTPEGSEARQQAEQQLEQLIQDQRPVIEAYIQARQHQESLEQQVLSNNIEPAEIQRVLDLPDQATGSAQDLATYQETRDELLTTHNVAGPRLLSVLQTPSDARPQQIDRLAAGDEAVRSKIESLLESYQSLSPRRQALERLKLEHPGRAERIDELAEAYAAYERVAGPLDDYQALVQLLQGAGVLEFRIAGTAGQRGQTPANAQEFRDRLHEDGPRAGTDLDWRWFKVQNVDQWADSERAHEAMAYNAPAYFALQHGLVGDAYGGEYYILLANTPDRAITRHDAGWELTSVGRGVDSAGRPAINFSLNPTGGSLMGTLTAGNVQRPMAILLDNQVVSAPTLQDRIQERGQITGRFSQADVDYLFRTLSAGSTEAELASEPSHISQVGPQLGEDNLRSGLTAAVLALVAVMFFITLYYFFAGMIANFALMANMVIILGVMAMTEAAFTLPGIAGIVLTIGMAVDANVLIFERIREETERGADLATSVRLGYEKALSTIIDANLTTLITCLVLGYTATADVRGFAVTLGIGILATLFTALFCTRLILDIYVRYTRAKSLQMLPMLVPAVRRLLSPNIDWLGKRYIFFTLSGALMLGGLVAIYARGGDILDIEFRSGTQITIELAGEQMMDITEARERLTAYAEAGKDLEQQVAPADEREREIHRDLSDILETRAAQAASEGETLEPVAWDLLADPNARVVRMGRGEGLMASGFTIATLIEDADLVSAVVQSAFDDVLESTGQIHFASNNNESVVQAPVYAIQSRDLGEVLGRREVTNDVGEYIGGIAILFEDMNPAPTLEQLEQRIRRMRMQPLFEDHGFPQSTLIGLTPAADQADDGQTRYASAVLVSHLGAFNYQQNPQSLDDPDGFAQNEWNLVRAAMEHGSALAGVTSFSGQVSHTMQLQAAQALILSLLAMAAYIWLRFGNIRYGLAAIAALTHDVIIALGLVAFSAFVADTVFGRALLLGEFRIDLAMVAAMLTIVGYSLNDTIIIFDRIRENRGRLAHATPAIINDSINQTVSRTVITSGTTLLAVTVLYIFGGPGIHGFAFAVLIGVVVGTYSSIAIATSLLLIAQRKVTSPGSEAKKQDATTQPATQG